MTGIVPGQSPPPSVQPWAERWFAISKVERWSRHTTLSIAPTVSVWLTSFVSRHAISDDTAALTIISTCESTVLVVAVATLTISAIRVMVAEALTS